jgi:hypothetical protein
VAFLVQGELLAQKEVFGGQGSGWTEAEPQEARGIEEQGAEDDHTLYQRMDCA